MIRRNAGTIIGYGHDNQILFFSDDNFDQPLQPGIVADRIDRVTDDVDKNLLQTNGIRRNLERMVRIGFVNMRPIP